MQFQYLLFLIILSHTTAEVVRRKRDMLTIRNFIRCLFGLGYEEPITPIIRPNYKSIYGVPNNYYYLTDTPGYAVTNLRNTISMNMLYPESLADGPYQIYREENSPLIYKNHFAPLVYEYNRPEPIYNLDQYKREPYVIEKSKVPIALNKYPPIYTANIDRGTIKLDNEKESLPQPPSNIQNRFQHLVHGNTVFLPIRPGKIENFVVPERDVLNVRPNFGEVQVFKYPLESVSLTKPTSEDAKEKFSQIAPPPALEQKITPYYFDNVNNFKYPVEHVTLKEPVRVDTTERYLQLVPSPVLDVKIPSHTFDNVNNFMYPVEHFTVKEPVNLDTTQTISQSSQTGVPIYPVEHVTLKVPVMMNTTERYLQLAPPPVPDVKIPSHTFDNVNNFMYPIEHFTVKEPVNLDTMQTISQLAQTRVPNVKIPPYTLDKLNNFKYPIERFSENEPVTIDKTDRFLQLVPSPVPAALLPPNFGDVHVSKYPLRRISLTKPAGTDTMKRFFQKVPSPVNMDDTMELTTVPTKAIMTNNASDSLQKSVKFTEPVRSKFVYKNVFHSEPNKNTIVEFDNKQKSIDGEKDSSIKVPLEPVEANESLPSDYFFLPPFTTEKSSYVPLNMTKETEDYIKHWTNIVKADQTKKQALMNKPVDVPDEPYTNKQQDLTINKFPLKENHRGDIPEHSAS